MHPPISSQHNPSFRHCLELLEQASYRHQQGQCLVEGAKLVDSYIQHHGAVALAISSEAMGPPTYPHQRHLLLSVRLFEQLCQLAQNQQPQLAVVAMPRLAAPLAPRMAVLIEAVQDPTNVGALIRSAAAAGADQLWLSPTCADPFSPRALRAGMGAQWAVPITVGADLVAVAQDFCGLRVAAHMVGRSLHQADLTGPVAFCFGNEGSGLSAQLLAQTDAQLSLLMSDAVESLNVNAAAAVFLFEKRRQDTLGFRAT